MEITITSAQGLKNSSLFSHRIRPFITLTTTPPPSSAAAHGGRRSHIHTTTVDHEGGVNPTWGDKFDLFIDDGFFYRTNSCIYLQLYTHRLLMGPRLLGWCGIPARDIADGLSPAGAVRQLSYRLRKKDGSRGDGVVNVVVRVKSSVFPVRRVEYSDVRRLPEVNFGRVAIGIPVTTAGVVGRLTGV